MFSNLEMKIKTMQYRLYGYIYRNGLRCDCMSHTVCDILYVLSNLYILSPIPSTTKPRKITLMAHHTFATGVEQRKNLSFQRDSNSLWDKKTENNKTPDSDTVTHLIQGLVNIGTVTGITSPINHFISSEINLIISEQTLIYCHYGSCHDSD